MGTRSKSKSRNSAKGLQIRIWDGLLEDSNLMQILDTSSKMDIFMAIAALAGNQRFAKDYSGEVSYREIRSLINFSGDDKRLHVILREMCRRLVDDFALSRLDMRIAGFSAIEGEAARGLRLFRRIYLNWDEKKLELCFFPTGLLLLGGIL
jgi:hypothetical protein